jgi:excinuclease ABC subunit B
VYRLHFNEETLELIELKDSISFEHKENRNKVTLRPATQFLQDISDIDTILEQMNAEKELRVKEFEEQGMLVEAERIKKRVEYDIRMIRETGFVNGIENYSLYFDNRLPGEPPNTIFDYFPDDFLLIVDESHMTIPQLRAMPGGDRARKANLIKYGFRLPSAVDHRPLRFEELEGILGRKDLKDITLDQAFDIDSNVSNTHIEIYNAYKKTKEARGENQLITLVKKHKKDTKSIFLSATPSEYEMKLSDKIIEQVIRPTGLLDPITYVYPKSGDYDALIISLETLMKQKPHLKEFMDGYTLKDGVEEVFSNE